MESTIFVPVLYVISFILSLYYLTSGKIKFSKISHYLFILAISVQIILLVHKDVNYASKNLEVNLFVIALLLSILCYLFIKPSIKNLYPLFVSPVTFILTVPIIFDIGQSNNLFFNNRILISHVLLNLLSHTILFVSVIFSLMFLYQYKNIKDKKINKIGRLPSLYLIEKINILLIILTAIGWLTFIFGMLLPIKYYLEKSYREY